MPHAAYSLPAHRSRRDETPPPHHHRCTSCLRSTSPSRVSALLRRKPAHRGTVRLRALCACVLAPPQPACAPRARATPLHHRRRRRHRHRRHRRCACAGARRVCSVAPHRRRRCCRCQLPPARRGGPAAPAAAARAAAGPGPTPAAAAAARALARTSARRATQQAARTAADAPCPRCCRCWRRCCWPRRCCRCRPTKRRRCEPQTTFSKRQANDEWHRRQRRSANEHAALHACGTHRARGGIGGAARHGGDARAGSQAGPPFRKERRGSASHACATQHEQLGTGRGAVLPRQTSSFHHCSAGGT